MANTGAAPAVALKAFGAEVASRFADDTSANQTGSFSKELPCSRALFLREKRR